jgi:drug/metabolite transporter (DMT)-like permease
VTEASLLLVLLSAVLHAGWNVWAKQSRDPTIFLGLFQAVTLVLSLALVPFVPWREVPVGVWTILPATGIFHYFYQRWLGAAYDGGDLTVVYPITRSTAAFVAILGPVFLHDEISWIGAVGIAVVLAGIWIVGTNGRIDPRKLVSAETRYAWLTLFTTVGYTLCDKSAMSSFDPAPWTSLVPKGVVYFLLVNAAHAALFGPWMLNRYGMPPLTSQLRGEWLPVGAAAIASGASYALILEALRTAPAGYVTATRQISVLFASILGIAMLGERPGRARISGAALTVAGVAAIGLWG